MIGLKFSKYIFSNEKVLIKREKGEFLSQSAVVDITLKIDIFYKKLCSLAVYKNNSCRI